MQNFPSIYSSPNETKISFNPGGTVQQKRMITTTHIDGRSPEWTSSNRVNRFQAHSDDGKASFGSYERSLSPEMKLAVTSGFHQHSSPMVKLQTGKNIDKSSQVYQQVYDNRAANLKSADHSVDKYAGSNFYSEFQPFRNNASPQLEGNSKQHYGHTWGNLKLHFGSGVYDERQNDKFFHTYSGLSGANHQNSSSIAPISTSGTKKVSFNTGPSVNSYSSSYQSREPIKVGGFPSSNMNANLTIPNYTYGNNESSTGQRQSYIHINPSSSQQQNVATTTKTTTYHQQSEPQIGNREQIVTRTTIINDHRKNSNTGQINDQKALMAGSASMAAAGASHQSYRHYQQYNDSENYGYLVENREKKVGVIDRIERPAYQKLYSTEEQDRRYLAMTDDPPVRAGCCTPLCWIPLCCCGFLLALIGMLCGLGVICGGVGGLLAGVAPQPLVEVDPIIVPHSTTPNIEVPAVIPGAYSANATEPLSIEPSVHSNDHGIPPKYNGSSVIIPGHIEPNRIAPSYNPVEPIPATGTTQPEFIEPQVIVPERVEPTAIPSIEPVIIPTVPSSNQNGSSPASSESQVTTVEVYEMAPIIERYGFSSGEAIPAEVVYGNTTTTTSYDANAASATRYVNSDTSAASSPVEAVPAAAIQLKESSTYQNQTNTSDQSGAASFESRVSAPAIEPVFFLPTVVNAQATDDSTSSVSSVREGSFNASNSFAAVNDSSSSSLSSFTGSNQSSNTISTESLNNGVSSQSSSPPYSTARNQGFIITETVTITKPQSISPSIIVPLPSAFNSQADTVTQTSDQKQFLSPTVATPVMAVENRNSVTSQATNTNSTVNQNQGTTEKQMSLQLEPEIVPATTTAAQNNSISLSQDSQRYLNGSMFSEPTQNASTLAQSNSMTPQTVETQTAPTFNYVEAINLEPQIVEISSGPEEQFSAEVVPVVIPATLTSS